MQRFIARFSQSSLLPLAKIANAPSRTLRLLWAAFAAVMFMILVICICLVANQYCRHQTVFQLDYPGLQTVYDQIPGFTVCPTAQEARRLFGEAIRHLKAMEGGMDRSDASSLNANADQVPWHNSRDMGLLRRHMLAVSPNASFRVLTRQLAEGQMTWSSQGNAQSPLYSLLHNFSVTFNIQPSQMARGYRLTVMEQVPNGRSFLCTTFELRSRSPLEKWSNVELHFDQQPSSTTPPIPFTVITHDRGELPFSAYDRHIYTILPPDTSVSIYYSKSVTKRLNSARNPCSTSTDAKSLAGTAAGDNKSNDDHAKRSFLDNINSSSLNSSFKAGYHDDDVVTADWSNDALDRLRLNDQIGSTESNPYTRWRPGQTDTIQLFGTHYLYSRESCGWRKCCYRCATKCQCWCSLDFLSATSATFDNASCGLTPEVSACAKSQCQDQIDYVTCPLPCVMTKFNKHNELREKGQEAELSPGSSVIKFVRSESVQLATEEEIFSPAKLFSEIGGLCSLFIGFSLVFVFELFEALLLMRSSRVGNQIDHAQSPTLVALDADRRMIDQKGGDDFVRTNYLPDSIGELPGCKAVDGLLVIPIRLKTRASNDSRQCKKQSKNGFGKDATHKQVHHEQSTTGVDSPLINLQGTRV